MGYLPELGRLPSARSILGEFKGYNHNIRIADGELYDMENLSSDGYPALQPRKKRVLTRRLSSPNGLFAAEKLAFADGTSFFYDGARVEGLTLLDSEKTMVSMGANILIWPDKVFYNTHDGTFGSLENSTQTAGTVSVALCRADGTAYESYSASPAPPDSPEDGALWVDTSQDTHALKQYSRVYGTWTSVPSVYTKIQAAGIGKGFQAYDGVEISGVAQESLNGSFVLYGAGEDFIVIPAVADQAFAQEESVAVKRGVPDMDYITENDNRLWGCSSKNHEIYASKLGDPKNWNCFMGVSTDSYAVTVGTQGGFTGAAAHLGYVLFFKENAIHEIYGSRPSNFQLTTTLLRGVEKGSEKSLVTVNETLYYKSAADVCAFNGALPSPISEKLGDKRYKNASAGALGSKYYLCMQDESGSFSLFVYDTSLRLWHREDGVHARFFAACGGRLYFINAADGGLYAVNGEDGEAEADFEWFAESGDIGLETPDRKYVSGLQLRLEAQPGAEVRVSVMYDRSGSWTEKHKICAARLKGCTVPIIPRRCDTMRIRISGRGSCRILSLSKTVETGSGV